MSAKYSRATLIVSGGIGTLFGTIVGGIEGIIGSLAIPTSIRLINDGLDRNIRDSFADGSVYDRFYSAAYHYPRLTGRVGILVTASSKIIEDLVNGKDVTYGW